MDKKRLQNLIDRISLTGPDGTKKIKKVLKELNDVSGGGGPSSGSMGEDEEYTIAQALNDLNGRIEALQLSISQNDIIIKIDSIEELSNDDNAKQQIVDAYSKGKLLSVILMDNDIYGFRATRIVGYVAIKEGQKYSLYIRYFCSAEGEDITTFVGQVDE